MNQEKKIWYRNDVPLFEELLGFKESLISDFMSGYDNLKDAVFGQCINTVDPSKYTDDTINQAEGMLVKRNPDTLVWETDFEAWKGVGIRNIVKVDGQVITDDQISEEKSKRYPTAMKMLNMYYNDLFSLTYSAIGPYSILHRHVGPENVDGEYIRIHIPLIIPEGDVFLDVDGQEVEWSDIFAFNNQYLHSAHNYTKEWRLILLIDLSRKLCNVEPGRRFSQGGTERQSPFIRGWKF